MRFFITILFFLSIALAAPLRGGFQTIPAPEKRSTTALDKRLLGALLTAGTFLSGARIGAANEREKQEEELEEQQEQAQQDGSNVQTQAGGTTQDEDSNDNDDNDSDSDSDSDDDD